MTPADSLYFLFVFVFVFVSVAEVAGGQTKKNRWSLIGFDLWWTSEYHCGSRHIIFVFVFVYVFVSVFVFLLLFLMLKKPQMVNDQLWSVVDAGV